MDASDSLVFVYFFASEIWNLTFFNSGVVRVGGCPVRGNHLCGAWGLRPANEDPIHA